LVADGVAELAVDIVDNDDEDEELGDLPDIV
jgi:hypothetical protein